MGVKTSGLASKIPIIYMAGTVKAAKSPAKTNGAKMSAITNKSKTRRILNEWIRFRAKNQGVPKTAKLNPTKEKYNTPKLLKISV
jgi:hypothetical protein